MTDADNAVDVPQLVKMVGYFATPFALLLGVSGVLVSNVEDTPRTLCYGLLGFSAFFNLVFPRMLSGQAQDKMGMNIRVRLFINTLVNVLLVYFLGRDFPAMWLILTLAPFATAIYGSRRKTAVTAATAVGLLVVIRLLHGDAGFAGWAATAAYAAFTVLISLMINGVANRVSRPETIL